MPVHDVHEILTELMLLVDNQIPNREREISRKLNDLAESVVAGGPEIQLSALSLGAYAIICRAWIFSCYNENSPNLPNSKQCRDAVLRSLTSLLTGKPEVLDDVGWQIISQSLEKGSSEATHILGLKLVKTVCYKSEPNRELFTFNFNLMGPTLAIISKSRPSNLLLREWCLTMKALLLSNDIKVGYNTAPERKRMIAKAKILPSLASKLHHSEYEQDEKTLNAVVILLASMAINDDLSNQIDSGHVLQGIHSILKNHFHSSILVRNTTALLRCLCCSQTVREKSSTYALMKWVVEIMENYKKNEDIIHVAISCCAYMTLRNSCQVAQPIAKNGLVVIQQLINDYKSNIPILKSALMILRNMIENGDNELKERIKGSYALLLNELMSQLELREYYVRPLLKDLEISGEKPDIEESPETVSYEVRLGRKSVVLDDNTSNEHILQI